MKEAVQNNLTYHEMDVKTASLHAPIEEEIEQPGGFQKTSDTGQKLVNKLK